MMVLFLNRPDSLAQPGGDTIQMLKTKQCLERLGVEVTVSYQLRPALSGFDLAHVFNLQRPDETLAQVSSVVRGKTPVVISPIVWDLWRLKFEAAARWRAVRRLLPKALVAPFCWAEQNALFRVRRGHRIAQGVLHMVDAILPNSRGEIEFLARRFGSGLREKCYVIPNAVDPSVFDQAKAGLETVPEGLPESGFVLQVGRIEPVKNQLGTLRALQHDDVPLVFVGAEPPGARAYAEHCRGLAKQRRDVFFLGPVPHQVLAAIYARAKVHVLPSFRETPGLASLEAGLMGCNVVTTDQGPTYEYFGPWAWYCNPASIRSIRQAIISALSAPRNKELQQRIRRYFTWDQAARRTLAVYERVLSSKQAQYASSLLLDAKPQPLA
ncbi:MAG: glycosyltransferase family 4 protein [candidate division WOR-3 bacterium]